MPIVSNHHTKRIVIGLALVLFFLGYSLMVLAGLSGAKHLLILSFLVASYLVVWGGYALISPIPKDEIRIQFVLMTLALGWRSCWPRLLPG